MDRVDITLRLPSELHAAALRLAAQDDITPGQLIRDLLSREVSRRLNARPPVRADERLVAPLRARLAPILAAATTWDEAQSALQRAGYVLREAGGGLALHDWPHDQRLCKASELGFSYSRLMLRFGAPFPGHRHGWLAARMLPEMAPKRDRDLEDFEVIEDDEAATAIDTRLSERFR